MKATLRLTTTFVVLVHRLIPHTDRISLLRRVRVVCHPSLQKQSRSYYQCGCQLAAYDCPNGVKHDGLRVAFRIVHVVQVDCSQVYVLQWLRRRCGQPEAKAKRRMSAAWHLENLRGGQP